MTGREHQDVVNIWTLVNFFCIYQRWLIALKIKILEVNVRLWELVISYQRI